MATSSTLEGRPTSAERATELESPGRDRFVEVLRAFAILALVGQHWMLPVLAGGGAVLPMTGSPAVLDGWASAYLGPALPLFFFAGGAATAIGLRNRLRPARTMPSWLADRVIRLAMPALPLAAAWLLLPRVLVAAGAAEPIQAAAEVVGRLLWFLAAYALLVLLTPVLVRLHERCRGREAIVMATGAVAVDITRFAGSDKESWLGAASVVLLLVAAFQLGIAYSEDRFDNIRRSRMLALGAGGMAVSALALAAGPDAVGLIGVSPPVTVLLALTAAQLGLALALRDTLSRWASRRPVGVMLAWICARATTIYLWHVPALAVVVGVATAGYNIPQLLGTGPYSHVPLRLAALTVVLAGFVRAFGRFERHPQWRPTHQRRGRASLNTKQPVCRVGSPVPGRKT